MYNNRELIDDLVKYMAATLNIATDSSMVILDMQDELLSIKDLAGFRKFVKENIAKQNKDFEYKTGYQKFLILTNNFKDKDIELTETESYYMNLFCDSLYKKITWYFDLLQDLLPTEKQLQRQIWKNHQYMGKDLINAKESLVVDEIGDTVHIYRLATRNKPLLQERIAQITEKFVKNKKRKQISLGNVQKVIKNG